MVSAILPGCFALLTAVAAAQAQTAQAPSAPPESVTRGAPQRVDRPKDPFARLFPLQQGTPPPQAA